ncbi:hypothetical protein GCM10027033_14810 [Leucobacter ruminantium]
MGVELESHRGAFRRYSVGMENIPPVLVLSITFGLFGSIVSFWILWAVIRGAVLSALRKHSEEQRGSGYRG